jgi:hypothetical protein
MEVSGQFYPRPFFFRDWSPLPIEYEAGWTAELYGRFGDTNTLPKPGIEPRSLGRSARRLVTILRVIPVTVFQNDFPSSYGSLLKSKRRATSVADTSVFPLCFLTRKAAAHFKATHFDSSQAADTAQVLTFPPLSHGTLQTVEIGFNFFQTNCRTANVKAKCKRKFH